MPVRAGAGRRLDGQHRRRGAGPQLSQAADAETERLIAALRAALEPSGLAEAPEKELLTAVCRRRGRIVADRAGSTSTWTSPRYRPTSGALASTSTPAISPGLAASGPLVRPSCSTPPPPARRRSPRPEPAVTAGLRLHLAVLRMAGRLAVQLEELARASQEPAFLRLLAEEAGPGGMDGSVLDLPPAAAVQPVDRSRRASASTLSTSTCWCSPRCRANGKGSPPSCATSTPSTRGRNGRAGRLTRRGGTHRRAPRRHAGRPPEAARERLTSGVLGRSGLVRLDRAAPRGRGDHPRPGGVGGPAGRGPMAGRVRP